MYIHAIHQQGVNLYYFTDVENISVCGLHDNHFISHTHYMCHLSCLLDHLTRKKAIAFTLEDIFQLFKLHVYKCLLT